MGIRIAALRWSMIGDLIEDTMIDDGEHGDSARESEQSDIGEHGLSFGESGSTETNSVREEAIKIKRTWLETNVMFYDGVDDVIIVCLVGILILGWKIYQESSSVENAAIWSRVRFVSTDRHEGSYRLSQDVDDRSGKWTSMFTALILV